MFTLPPDRQLRASFDFISPFLALPNLRGFWPLNTTLDAGANFYDLTPHARTLTNNNAVPVAIYNDYTAYADFDGVNQYLSRASETGLAITAGLTLGGWFWTDTLAPGTNSGLIGKWTDSTSNRSYLLFFNDTDNTLNFVVSSDGIASTTVTGEAMVASRWYWVVGRYNPSTELAIFVNSTETDNTVSIPASIFNSTAALEIGAYTGANNFLNGRGSRCFLCAATLSDTLINSIFAQTRHFFDV